MVSIIRRHRVQPEPYPLPHEKGVIRAFDSSANLTPRFGQPSAVLITALKEAGRRQRRRTA